MTALDRMTTDRLLLRRWTEADRVPFAAMNADPRVMAHFPTLLSRAESDALIDRIEAGFRADGFGPWAVVRQRDGAFIGMAGLKRVPFEAAFSPAVEILWRFAPEAWGQGYATEAAQGALAAGFQFFGLERIVSFTARENERSIAVMRRLAMAEGEPFEHPALPPGHRLRPHRLFAIDRATWIATAPSVPPPP